MRTAVSVVGGPVAGRPVLLGRIRALGNSAWTIACDLTSWAGLRPSFCSVPGLGMAFADVVTGCLVPVGGALRASRAWFAGFRRGCGGAGCRTNGAKTPPDPGRGHRARRPGAPAGEPPG